MSPNKACPVILSNIAGPRILLLRHPLAGVQLVKGTIESGEAHPVLRRALGYLATMLFGEAQES